MVIILIKLHFKSYMQMIVTVPGTKPVVRKKQGDNVVKNHIWEITLSFPGTKKLQSKNHCDYFAVSISWPTETNHGDNFLVSIFRTNSSCSWHSSISGSSTVPLVEEPRCQPSRALDSAHPSVAWTGNLITASSDLEVWMSTCSPSWRYHLKKQGCC